MFEGRWEWEGEIVGSELCPEARGMEWGNCGGRKNLSGQVQV